MRPGYLLVRMSLAAACFVAIDRCASSWSSTSPPAAACTALASSKRQGIQMEACCSTCLELPPILQQLKRDLSTARAERSS